MAIVAPASPVPRDDFAAGAAILGARYQLVHDERIFAKRGFLAGSDDERLAELTRALADPTLEALFCARGGYGIMRLLDRLDGAAFARAPKLVIGFSDVTALHAFAARAGVVSVHGPVITQLAKLPSEDVTALFALLESREPPRLSGLAGTIDAPIEGRFVGGNLEMLSRLVGTPWAFDFTDGILLIEEIGERPYRIDRALTQLILSGAFARLRGAVIGDLEKCGDANSSPSAAEVIVERLGSLGIPVLSGAPIGHGLSNRALPIGARARLHPGDGGVTLEFLEGAVA